VALDPQLQGALAARIKYFRDLGVFDFYRRGEPLLAEETAMASQNVTAIATEPSPPNFFEGKPEMPRAVPAVRPLIPSPTLPVIASAPIAPELRAAALQAIRDEIGDCQRCPLAPTRNKLVFGDGDPNARLMFVGEGPGADEDAQGLPFVGRGGQLLNNMINAMGLKREEVYIANIVKCRPPKNRVPEPIEANTCKPFLFQQIEVIQPEVIVALGSTAATYLLGAKTSLSSLRGRIHHAFNTKLIVTYHPAFLLRDPTQKKEAWKDLQLAMAELGLQTKRPG
jgi:DNA polymerase